MFSAPIPGQSLTSEPKNSPWENPPEFSAPEDAVLWHLDRLSEPKKIKAALALMEMDLDVVTLVEGILRGAVIEGRHSVDVSLIIGPILHEYLVGSADIAGIDYNEGLDEDMSDEDFNYAIQENRAKKILSDYKKTGAVTIEEDKSIPEIPAMEEDEEMVQENKPVGLMARGVA